MDPEQPSDELARLSAIEPAELSERRALQKEWNVEFIRWLGETDKSIGYPGWNLLYYALLTSLSPSMSDHVVVESGTNRGLSTIVMAQALKDLEVEARVDTVDIDPDNSAAARDHVEAAGLSDYVNFHVGDSQEFLADLVEQVPHIDFAFIDSDHHAAHVQKEVDIVCAKVAVRRGKIYFDNSEPGGGSDGGVAEALEYVKSTYGGNLVRFVNCSLRPPGNAIWQPD